MKMYGLEMPEKIFGIDSALIGAFMPLLGVILFIIVSVNLVVVPKFEEFSTLNTKLSTTENQTARTLEKTKYLQSVNQEDLKRDADFISSALLPESNSYFLVGVVGKVASKYGFQIDSFVINPGKISEAPKVGTDGVVKIPVTLSLVGPTSRHLELIDGMETSLPILSIDTFDMKSDNGVSRLDLKVLAFYVESRSKVDINKLTLSELSLKKEEADLLSKIGQYTIWDNLSSNTLQKGQGVEFKDYGRLDPFSP